MGGPPPVTILVVPSALAAWQRHFWIVELDVSRGAAWSRWWKEHIVTTGHITPPDAVAEAVGLRDRLTHRPSQLSGGQVQRVACARALVSRPTIVFADEPTGNLDSRSSGEILSFLRRSVDEFGQSIVMVTHDPTAASYADRVLFLTDGRIVDEMDAPTAERVLERMKSLGD